MYEILNQIDQSGSRKGIPVIVVHTGTKKQLKKEKKKKEMLLLFSVYSVKKLPPQNQLKILTVSTHHFLSHTNTLIFKLLTPYVHY